MSTGKRQLVEVVAALRSDLEAAIAEGEGEKVKFDLTEVEIDLHTQISKSGEANAKGEVEFKILGFEIGKASAEAKGSYSKENSHTIRLKLKPKRWNDTKKTHEDVELSDLD